jgi:transcription termination factor Rho
MTDSRLAQRHLADLHELADRLGIERYRMLDRNRLVETITDADPEAAEAAEKAVERGSGRGEGTGRDDDREGGDGRRSRGRRRRGGRRRSDEGADRRREAEPDAEPEPVRGTLEITSRGHGFIRPEEGEGPGEDVYVSPSQIRRCELEDGDIVAGPARPPRRGERHHALVHIDTVNGEAPGEHRARFEELEAAPPSRRIQLTAEDAANEDEAILLRTVDLLFPLAHGQRIRIDAAPGSGRTTLTRALARALGRAEDLELVVLLVDERPEEEASWRQTVGEDTDLQVAGAGLRAGEQLKLVEAALARATRSATAGNDTVLVVDSLSRIAVAGGDPSRAKPIFAAGRQPADEEAGALTVIATTLHDGADENGVSRALETTENVLITLDRELATAGIYPAIDLAASRIAGEERLRDDTELTGSRALRAELAGLPARDAAERLRERFAASATNESLLASAAT